MPVVTNFLGGSLRLPLQVGQSQSIIKHHTAIIIIFVLPPSLHHDQSTDSVQSTLGGTSKAQQSSPSSIIGWVLTFYMQPPKLPKVLFQNHNSWWKADARWTCGLVLPVENLSAASQSLNSTLPQGIQIWLIQVTFHQLHVYYFDRFWSCSMFILQGTSPCVLQTSVTSSDARLRWNIVRILCSSIQPFALCVCGENMVLSWLSGWTWASRSNVF